MSSVEDKENASEIETIIIDDTSSDKVENTNTFFSPPKKKFKQDSLSFVKTPEIDGSLKKEQNGPDEKISEDLLHKGERKLSELSNNKSINKINAKNVTCIKNDDSAKVSPPPKKGIAPKSKCSEQNIKSKTSPKVNKSNETKTEGISFPKLSKEDALKESEKEVEIMITKTKERETSEGISFPKLSKEEALKEAEKEVQNMLEKEKEQDVNGDDNDEEASVDEADTSNNDTINDTNSDTPNSKKPSSAKKASPLSKEERQKSKDEKEKLKAARLKDLEEKRKKKEEEKIAKQAEKEKRENERKEKERLREEEKKKREEEKKIKEEEKQKKDESIKFEKEKKDAEKKEKEIERKMKEDQKRQEEEKKKQEDEALKKKKEKAANQFRSFFTKKTTTNKAPTVEVYQRFKPFQVTDDMTLAPLVRNENINRGLLDKVLEDDTSDLNTSDLNTYLIEQSADRSQNKRRKYLTRRKKRHDLEEKRKLELQNNPELRKKEHVKKSKLNNSSITNIENVVVIDDNSNDMVDEDDDTENENETETDICNEKYLYVAKLLQFSENTRPAYYGTWRKKSSCISGKKPFRLDKGVFNYDIDSDEEWIDEPGENLSDAPDEDEEEEKETEDDQDGFFVPHGYLSDDEGIKDVLDEDEEEDKDDDGSTKGPIGNKNEDDKLKLKICTFERRLKKLKLQKPTCIGITYPQHTNGECMMNPILKDFIKVVLFKPENDKEKEKEEEDAADAEVNSPDSGRNTPKSAIENGCNNNIPLTVPEEAMPILIRYVHGNVASIRTMMSKFSEYWDTYAKENELRPQISKRQLERKIQSIASRVSNKEVGKICYVVKEDVIDKYGLKNNLKYGEGLPELKNVKTSSKLELVTPVKKLTENNEGMKEGNETNNVDICMEVE